MKSIAVSIVAAGVLIGGAVLFSGVRSSGAGAPVQANNVSIVDGKQIVEVSVKGGYHPQKSVAKAGVPTTLRFATDGTYDCSSSIRIPSMGVAKSLPASGKTDIDLGSPKVAVLRGTCGMGMYTFEIDFQG